jgi:hypothetical protein
VETVSNWSTVLFTTIVTALAQSVVLPFGYVVYVLLYYTVRIEKEGFDLEHLADTFLPEQELATPFRETPPS